MARIAKALVSDGPALALTAIEATTVPSKTALVVTTTGSSGIPKQVGLSASALLTSARASNAFLGAEFGSTWSLLLPLNHIAGINVLIRSLELGTTPTYLLGHEGKFPKVDYTAIVPTQLYRALNGDENLLQHLQSAKAVLVGGAALTQQLRTTATEAGINVIETYGSTETSGGCIYDGVPLEGVEIAIGDQGRIAIKGKVIAHELVSEDGWYYTSDAGRIENGKLIVEGR
ncbi:MAG: AMP-binding protein, partial [Candidatus Planktophila sp.]